jgi:hypothetical protein
MQRLVEEGRSVLLSAYTNSALDNVLLKVVSKGNTDLLRLGRTSNVHPDIKPYLPRVPAGNDPAAAIAMRKHVRPDCTAPTPDHQQHSFHATLYALLASGRATIRDTLSSSLLILHASAHEHKCLYLHKRMHVSLILAVAEQWSFMAHCM